MSATVIPFHSLQAGAAAFRRALGFEYRPNTARALQRVARREANVWEDPEDTAARIVRRPHESATTHEPRPAA